MAKSPRSARSTAARAAPGQPRHLQVAALCWRRSEKGVRILLITSRETGRWVIPKGWPMRNRSEAQAAAREAWEEAGLRGSISERSLGLYTYQKLLAPGRSIACVVRVYPLAAEEMLRRYPESGQRRIRWFSPAKAAQRVAEPELRALIRDFDPDASHPPEPDDDGTAGGADQPPDDGASSP
jgi:8-oxo-dGTP pyrophosphatase MutT (NUDIX family)